MRYGSKCLLRTIVRASPMAMSSGEIEFGNRMLCSVVMFSTRVSISSRILVYASLSMNGLIVSKTKLEAELTTLWKMLPMKPRFWKSIDISSNAMSRLMSCVRTLPSRSTPSDTLPFVSTFFKITVNGPSARLKNVLSV
uniref:(northern house mosquito) hypothetical protein n=1 Tax=Culex pipiens TaxID=7175 RepID=A0A8D8P5U3_CULPI